MSEQGLSAEPTEDVNLVPTQCKDWSLNADPESDKRFWWNETYSISLWEESLKFKKPENTLQDDDIWREFIRFQLGYVFKMCSVCREPEGNDDLFICCYCANTVHKECSILAEQSQIDWKPANRYFLNSLRCCFECEGIEHKTIGAFGSSREPDSVCRAAVRFFTLKDEFSSRLAADVETIIQQACKKEDENLMQRLQKLSQRFFQSTESLRFLKKEGIASKGGGTGVVATADIPAFTIIGVYPGYPDSRSGEQAKIGRPVPVYALMDLNCANYYNEVFVEFSGTFTPFINEPNETEMSNCAWIQEPHRAEERLSVISVKDIRKGEELLIGYGPLYPRSYPHRYDAYALHVDESHTSFTYAVWHWPTLDEADAKFVCNVKYDSASDTYSRII